MRSANRRLAYAYIFPKGKKDYTNARPVISFYGNTYEKMLKATAAMLSDMCSDVLEDTFHIDTIPATFSRLHKFFQQHGEALADFTFLNDDLSGFYTSVPQERITSSVGELIRLYFVKHPCKTPQDATIDVATIVAFTLRSTYFSVFDQVFHQVQGSCIGSPISPTLCNITVAITEHHWLRTGKILIANTSYINRYVDNRAIICPSWLLHHHELRTFTQLDFYVPPIQLEPCANAIYLGQAIDLHRQTISYVMPSQQWQIRSAMSAGSTALNAMGFQSRLHIIYRDS
jgi:hypothetical protein